MQVGHPKDSAWQTLTGQQENPRPVREGDLPRTEWTDVARRLREEADEAKRAAKKAERVAADDAKRARSEGKDPSRDLQRKAESARSIAAWSERAAKQAARLKDIGNDGHRSDAFTPEDSFFWGVLWLLYKMNQSTDGGAAWNLRDCSWDYLIGGAV